MKKILILGAPIFQIPIVNKAKEMGLYVGIVDIDDTAPALKYADEYFIASIRDKETILKIAKDFKPDGIVIGACDTSVRAGAYVCEKLGLPGPTYEVALNATDKLKMLKCFEKNNVPHPQYQLLKKEEVINNDYRINIPYPVISKPIDSAGSRGVCIIHNEQELKKALLYSSNSGISGDILVEEYMQGPEVSVEVIVLNGIPYILQITDKITSGEPNFYEIGHSQPSALPENIKEKIKEVAGKAALAVGLINSPAHVEIKITEDGPKMIELGARLGGDCITTYLIENSVTGINMVETAIKIALGENIIISDYKNSGICSAIRFIPSKKGTVKSITGVEQANKEKDVININIIATVGTNYDNATNNSARFGYVICQGKTTKEALDNCTKVISLIKIEME